MFEAVIWGLMFFAALGDLVGLWLMHKAWEIDVKRLGDCEAELETLRGELRAEEAQRKALELRLDNAFYKTGQDVKWAQVEKAFDRVEQALDRGEA